MILYINTVLKNKIKVALYNKQGKEIKSKEKKIDRTESEELLKVIDYILGEKSINGIIVVKGPKGRFSAVRTGVVCANVLGFAWDIPVVGIRNDVAVDLPNVLSKLQEPLKFTKLVKPEYSQKLMI